MTRHHQPSTNLLGRRPRLPRRSGLRPLLYACLAASSISLAPLDACAQEDDTFSFGPDGAVFVAGGLTTGGSFGSLGGGGFLGGELSLAWFRSLWWFGLYADGAYDFAHEAGTLSVGPELGWAIVGLDGGLGIRLGVEDDPELGVHARGLISLGLLAVFGRYGYWPDAPRGEHVGQVGLLLKFPFWNSSEAGEMAP